MPDKTVVEISGATRDTDGTAIGEWHFRATFSTRITAERKQVARMLRDIAELVERGESSPSEEEADDNSRLYH